MERWTVSLAPGAAELPLLPGSDDVVEGFDTRILDREDRGRQIQLTVLRPDEAWLWRLRDHPAVAEVAVHVPTLEDIFVLCSKDATRMQVALGGQAESHAAPQR
jgi:hypothetical protein